MRNDSINLMVETLYQIENIHKALENQIIQPAYINWELVSKRINFVLSELDSIRDQTDPQIVTE